VALYGPHFSAPGDALVITQQPDTTPPAIRSASVDPGTVAHSQLATTLFKGQAQLAPAIAAVDNVRCIVYDASGHVVGDLSEGQFESNGQVGFTVPLPADSAPGVYTVGFVLTDFGGLSTSFGTPGGTPIPAGPLTLTVTDN
jgi:hypothetical protein